MAFRILVTGSSGFIGSAVITALANAGHSVRAASRKPIRIADPDRIEWMRLPDLETEFDWAPLLEGIDIVVHLAAIAHRTQANSGDYTKAIRIATANLALACRRQQIKRLIFMSSIGAQAGSAADHVVTEQDEPWPITAYDRAKLAAEEEVRRSGAPFSILRPVIVYGPGAKANMALILRIAALPLPLPFGAFRNQRSLLSIDNLVQAVIVCLDGAETLNRTFIVCDEAPITLAEMLKTLREAAGRPARLISVPPLAVRAMVIAAGRQALWDRIGRELVASSASLQKAGWSPRVETKAGLTAMVRAALDAPSE
ncbi:NAD-dependent epimerase/dehydratase family protein [Bradyrhizobium sp.]|uniref:NAD-dependent epimerase/dehydratase family protein n=1 Tax=Bradyrhizobium sp. TaxID=376 RepID=UPI00272F334C|nr:NAD-dependent epimerase/dehydratase family protein [Bradyrhizobium sp.]MDP3075364.1 NAD-dependent epimerase/dehydratase family protein [Bradyrhizobium sp.]